MQPTRDLVSTILFVALFPFALAAQQVPSVIVSVVIERDVTPQFEYVGRVEAVETVDLRARVEGFLERQTFREGAEVEKGACPSSKSLGQLMA